MCCKSVIVLAVSQNLKLIVGFVETNVWFELFVYWYILNSYWLSTVWLATEIIVYLSFSASLHFKYKIFFGYVIKQRKFSKHAVVLHYANFWLDKNNPVLFRSCRPINFHDINNLHIKFIHFFTVNFFQLNLHIRK